MFNLLCMKDFKIRNKRDWINTLDEFFYEKMFFNRIKKEWYYKNKYGYGSTTEDLFNFQDKVGKEVKKQFSNKYKTGLSDWRNYFRYFKVTVSLVEEFFSFSIKESFKKRIERIKWKLKSGGKKSKRARGFIFLSSLIKFSNISLDLKTNKILIKNTNIPSLKLFLKKFSTRKEKTSDNFFKNLFKKTKTSSLLSLIKDLKSWVFIVFFKNNFKKQGSKTYKFFLFFKRLHLRFFLLIQAYLQIKEDLYKKKVIFFQKYNFYKYIYESYFVTRSFIYRVIMIIYKFFLFYYLLCGLCNLIMLHAHTLYIWCDYIPEWFSLRYAYYAHKAVWEHFLYTLGYTYVWIFFKSINFVISTTAGCFIFFKKLVVFKSLLFIIGMFILYLYIRSSVPRYKLVDFQNFYWKYILVYVVVIHIITVVILIICC